MICGRKSKGIFWLFFLVFWLSVCSSWAEGVTLTEEEYNELTSLLKTQEKALTEQQRTISSLKTKLEEALTWQKTQRGTIETLCLQIDALKKSSEMLRPDPVSLSAGVIYTSDSPGVYAGVSFQF